MVYSQRWFSQFVFHFCIWFLSWVAFCLRACWPARFYFRILFQVCICFAFGFFLHSEVLVGVSIPLFCCVCCFLNFCCFLSLDWLFYGVCMHLYAIAVYGLYCNCYLRYCCCWRRCVVLICCLVFVVMGGGLFSSFVRCTPPVSILFACMFAWPFTCMFGYVAQSLAIINSVYATFL